MKLQVDHPNLAAWRAVRDRTDEFGGGAVTAVLVRSAEDPASSATDTLLRSRW